jgi:hypothetical protein
VFKADKKLPTRGAGQQHTSSSISSEEGALTPSPHLRWMFQPFKFHTLIK